MTSRPLQHNLSHGINELVDIASRSMTTSSSDSTTAREAVLHLGVVMRELLLHDLPLVHQHDDRQLVRPQNLGFDDYCEAAFGRIRDVGGHSHELMTTLLATIDTIRQQFEDAQLWDRQALLQQHAQLVVDEADTAPRSPAPSTAWPIGPTSPSLRTNLRTPERLGRHGWVP